jgi:hypothetical protein
MGLVNSRRRALRDTMAAFEDRGTPIRAARIHRDGSVDLLTTELDAARPADEGDLLELAGAPEIHRAQGA